MDLNKLAVKLDNGSLDANATADAVYEACVAENASRDSDMEKVSTAVGAIFARFPDSDTLNMSFLKSQVCTDLGATPDTHTRIQDRVQDYVSSHKGTLFNVKKGSGVSLVKATA